MTLVRAATCTGVAGCKGSWQKRLGFESVGAGME